MAAKSTNIVDVKDIKKLFRLIFGNWYIILICCAFSLVLAYLYSYKLPKIYAAKSQLLLQASESYSIQKSLFAEFDVLGAGFYEMSSEIRVLGSADIVSQVVSKLELDVSYYIVGRIQTKEVYSGTPFSVKAEVYSPSFYEFPFTFKILDVDNYEISYDSNGQLVVERHKFGEQVINKNYYLVINKSSAISASTISSLKEITYQFMVHDRANLVRNYKANMSVLNLDYTSILEVTMEDEIPERAVMFLDTLAKVYMNNSLKSRIRVNENTISYIDRQLSEITSILDSIEDILDKYKDQKNILNLSKEENQYFSSLRDFESQKRALELQLKAMDYLKNYIVSNLNKELLPPFSYIDNNDVYLKQTVGELYNLQVKINSAMFSSTENSTSIKEIEYRIELLRNDILKYIVNAVKAIHQKIEAIEGEIAYYEGMLKGVPKDQRQILNINRKLGVNEKMYLYLLEKRAETIIARAGIISDVSIIESAHSEGVVKPDKEKIYTSFLTAGLLLALIISFVRTVLFSKIENMEELRELTQLPILGEVFHSKDAKDGYLIVESQPRSFVTEAFRALRTNLEYFSPEVKCKTILITSNRPGVGKTFCSVNLAAILAKGGKKVLLMEMDLHKPKVHTALSIVQEAGISSLLVGKCTPAEVISKTATENLDVIIAGPTPPNASELILSAHLPKLFVYAKEHYDYIVIDTPPMGLISDAQMLMKYSDINIFILNTRHNAPESLHFAESMIENKQSGSFVFALNNVKPKFSKYYSKNYRYAYGYNTES